VFLGRPTNLGLCSPEAAGKGGSIAWRDPGDLQGTHIDLPQRREAEGRAVGAQEAGQGSEAHSDEGDIAQRACARAGAAAVG